MPVTSFTRRLRVGVSASTSGFIGDTRSYSLRRAAPAAASSKRQSGFIIPDMGRGKPETACLNVSGNRFCDSLRTSLSSKLLPGRGKGTAELQAPDPVTAGQHVEYVFAVGSLASRSAVDLGVGHTCRVAEQVLMHCGCGHLVRLPATLMLSQAAQNVRLGQGRSIPL